MRKSFGLVLVSVFIGFSATAFADNSGGPGPDPWPHDDNQWHLGYSVDGYSDTGTFTEVAKVSHGDQDADHPQEENDTYKDMTNKIVLTGPGTECSNAGPPQTNACTFTDHSAQQDGDHQIRYHYRSWGGRCYMWSDVMVFPKVANWVWAPDEPWSTGSVFVVVVPPNANGAVVFGKLHGTNIYLTPSDPLSAQDSTSFDLVEHPTTKPGLGTIYRIRAK